MHSIRVGPRSMSRPSLDNAIFEPLQSCSWFLAHGDKKDSGERFAQ